ncbi:MAG: metal-dependent transcriptional regulator [Candidatus Nanopelagicales bacterium]
MSDLIDTTEMYLRTIYELAEEGIRPMRARIAERLGQSGPTVSQTVARMQRDGLVEIDADDRHLVLTPEGATLATRVMRKHRLAECLLVEVIGLPWAEVHTEACRWEHVMSQAVEQRLLALLDHPTHSPFGNPIPGLAELATSSDPDAGQRIGMPSGLPGRPLSAVVGAAATPSDAADAVAVQTVAVVRIAEPLQADEVTMAELHRIGVFPGQTMQARGEGKGIGLDCIAGGLEITRAQAGHIIVTLAPAL